MVSTFVFNSPIFVGVYEGKRCDDECLDLENAWSMPKTHHLNLIEMIEFY